ncbi:hypothetical protein [Filifactor alocis]|nr:hypothetical protein [Filifactor alocis]
MDKCCSKKMMSVRHVVRKFNRIATNVNREEMYSMPNHVITEKIII